MNERPVPRDDLDAHILDEIERDPDMAARFKVADYRARAEAAEVDLAALIDVAREGARTLRAIVMQYLPAVPAYTASEAIFTVVHAIEDRVPTSLQREETK